MKDYKVTIKETLARTVTVKADSREEAEGIVKLQWKDGIYVLDADDFIGVAFHAKQTRERGNER